MKIRKAIIPAAGLGTRVLPASKSCPKEMLNIVDKPAIQYIVEEAVKAGITDILIITNRGKGVIEDHFDHSFELEAHLRAKGRNDTADELAALASIANIYYIRQKETKGLGHAVLQAKEFVGNEPFAVLYGDDVIIGEDPAIAQLCRATEKYSKCSVCIKEVPTQLVKKYCSLKVEKLEDNMYSVSDMIEKPKEEEIFSNFAILGRCVLTPDIFEILSRTPYGANGELQLTDAMREIAVKEGMVGVDFTGIRYDMGNKLGIMKANVEVALGHKEIGKDFKEYLKEIVAKIDE
ncbi:MAG: UTP--glucose-1-phosphate uridylyltransferase GalU [Acutalibacteraceae bacterium]|nr:UTP--glucose-1-phosphate uridylyltransferase GalU [Acutalibacteraceae bacterium]